MIGLMVDGRPLLRAYSIASANYEDHLEFFSIKVPDGPLTSRLQNIQVGDELLVSNKPTGTLLLQDLHPGRHLYFLSTGTGLAPFMCLVRDPEVYERFDKIILVHGVRKVDDLAYYDYLTQDLPNDENLGELVREKLIYYPTVTRESFRNTGRLTDLLRSDKLTDDIGLKPLNPVQDRVMICGSQQMLDDTCALLDERGFKESPGIGELGDYVFERAFAPPKKPKV
jgi:ferredoxin--NADP+ reductase